MLVLRPQQTSARAGIRAAMTNETLRRWFNVGWGCFAACSIHACMHHACCMNACTMLHGCTR